MLDMTAPTNNGKERCAEDELFASSLLALVNEKLRYKGNKEMETTMLTTLGRGLSLMLSRQRRPYSMRLG